MAEREAGAIILAGGLSRRMGTDKALLRLKPGGPRIIEMVLAAASAVATEVVISTNRPELYSWLDLPLVPDNFPGAGPLAGLEAGLSRSTARYNLLLACDMPFVQPKLLRFLLDLAAQHSAVIPLSREGRPEPLCGIYSRECLPHIREHLRAGKYKMTGWLEYLPVRYVAADELLEYDPALRSFDNLNTPEDLEQAR
ncbi:MAG TPA: molybdenum cofactor guanylyltransferase [Chloroflexia bacterium]|nr:molybdenum cofactor guanylyltransferase [Chloroflexia bacterium]